MRKLLIVAGIIAVAANFILALPVAAAATFSLTDVFDDPAHHAIDHECGDARAFADRAAKTIDDIESDAAISAARAYMACYNMPRVMQDVEKERYLLISAAAALYLAGTKASGSSADRLFENAYFFDDALVSRKTIPSAGELNVLVISRNSGGGGTLSSNTFREPDPGVEAYARVAAAMERAIIDRLSQEQPAEPSPEPSP